MPVPRHQICFFFSLRLSLSRAASICSPRSCLTTSHIVTRKHLSEAMQEYPDAANEIKAWVAIVEGVRWHNFAEVRLMFRDADYINGYVVFNIRRTATSSSRSFTMQRQKVRNGRMNMSIFGPS